MAINTSGWNQFAIDYNLGEDDFFNSPAFKNAPEKFKNQFKETYYQIHKPHHDLQNNLKQINDTANQVLNNLIAKLEAQEKARQEEEERQRAAEAEAQRIAAEQAAKVKGELVAQSQDFDAKKEGLIQNIMGVAGEDARLALSDQKRDIAENAAARGLYHSGIKEKALADVQDAASQDLMAKQIAVNEDAQAQSDAYNQLAAEGVRDNESLIFGNMAQRQANALNSYQQGLQNRRARLNARAGTRSLIGGSNQVFNNYRDFLDNNVKSGYAPEVFQAIGSVAGRGIEGYYSRKNKGTA